MKKKSAAAARAEVFDALHQEMEFADYCTADTGFKVKRVPRNQRAKRTVKRLALTQADLMQSGIEKDADDGSDAEAYGGKGGKKKRKRLRGTKVAFDDVVLKSMPAANSATEIVTRDADGIENGEDEEAHDMLQEMASLGIDLDPDVIGNVKDLEQGEEENVVDDTENSGSECDEIKYDQKEKETKTQSEGDGFKVSVCHTGLIKPKNTTKRFMHRLREFTSERLAQKHGEAIGAHIRGMSETAVQKLREVAKAAPGAPQVYSSLGMVFDSMLTEVEGGGAKQGENETEENSRLNHLQRRLELVQKTYAAYHVASCLCKRDFVLWERSGDAAVKGSQLYSEIIEHMTNNPMATRGASEEAVSTGDPTIGKGFDPNAGPEKWKSDRRIWLEHALSAYQSSDSLHPPGLDIPCKLAQMHILMGNLIEALSIMTDLKNKVVGEPSGSDNVSERELGRSEMEGSYPCWLLYADLMMKLGSECKLWNDGTSTTDKYMFKRWLRKNSKVFDWKERRLQALCLAMESAAGSVSCANLIKWMRERAEKLCDENEKEAPACDESDSDEEEEEEAKKNIIDKDESCMTNTIRGEEMERLVNMNKVELQNFDRMTREMNVVKGSIVFRNRVVSREKLVKKHRNSIRTCAVRQYTKEQEATANKEQPEDLPEYEPSQKNLPLRGSRATVYDIAALLLKQCVHLKLFEGGLLAVQSVLDYSNVRVSRYERAVELRKENELVQNTVQGLVQPGFKYDQINFEADVSDEVFISDDEELEQPGVLQLLKSGRLPVATRAMHAICLFGNGGQDYIALRYLNQVISNELDSSDEEEISLDDGIADGQKLSLKNFVLSSVADLAVTDNFKGHPQSLRSLLSILKKHFLTNVMINQGLDFDEVLANPKELERIHALNILQGTLKLLIDCARMDLALLDGLGKKEVNTIKHAVTDTVYALKVMTRFQYILWNPCVTDWSLDQPSIDMVSILSGAISVLVQVASLDQDKLLLDSVYVGYQKSRQLISKICQADDADSEPCEFSCATSWRSFPLPHAWQTNFHEKISLRAYNLCVAGCVSSFSGWEPNEFNLDQLRKSDTNFFGVLLEGPCVAGFLPNNAASAVAEQWDYISQILPELEFLPFDTHLDNRKRMSWYQKVKKNIEKLSIGPTQIATYGEMNGIRALLSFSTLCLLLAEESEEDEKDEFVKLSMSVLLPMTQFSIDKQIWQSARGTLAMTCGNETKIGYYLDENCHWSGPTKSKGGTMQYSNNKTLFKPSSRVARRPTQDRRPTKVVKIRTSVLLEEWRKNDVLVEEKRCASEYAQRSMKNLDDAMKNLRKSRTLNSLERASIDVAVALIALVTYEECNNPFVCMQQAAMFAAMGSKRGTNDEPFKRFLPMKTQCSPLEALEVLCRADCLRAVYFLDEAQYLCTWVTSVCQAHRDMLVKEFSWNSRWQIIGILTYIVSTTIDETIDALSLEDPSAGSPRKWGEVAKMEIDRGKADAIFLAETTENNALPAIEKKSLEDIGGPVGMFSKKHINKLYRSRWHGIGPETISASDDQSHVNNLNYFGHESGSAGAEVSLLNNQNHTNKIYHFARQREVPGAKVPLLIDQNHSNKLNKLACQREVPGAEVRLPSDQNHMNELSNSAQQSSSPGIEIPLLSDRNQLARQREVPGAEVRLPSDQNHMNELNNSPQQSSSPGIEIPLLSDQNHLNGMDGYFDQINGLNVEQYLNEGLNEPEIEGEIQNENDDNDDPFAGVEVVGI